MKVHGDCLFLLSQSIGLQELANPEHPDFEEDDHDHQSIQRRFRAAVSGIRKQVMVRSIKTEAQEFRCSQSPRDLAGEEAGASPLPDCEYFEMSYCLLLTAFCLLPSAFCLLSKAGGQRAA